MDRQDSPYRRGNLYTAMPIPMVPEMCVPIDAGPVRFIVESRQLTNAILAETYKDEEIPDGHVEFDDYGPTLHVCGVADGLEHLRFDCFEHEPHYHYIRNAEQSNVVVRIDEVAVGDPIEFTLRCLRTQLPEMLGLAGAGELGEMARTAHDDVIAALDKAGELMERAR
jgi:hypothetical protein